MAKNIKQTQNDQEQENLQRMIGHAEELEFLTADQIEQRRYDPRYITVDLTPPKK